MEGNRRRGSKSANSNDSNRRLVVWLSVLLLLAIVGVVGWRTKGSVMYGRWRDDRLLTRAEELLQAGKLKDASFAARRLFQQDINNVRAMRLMAQIAARLGLRDAILWRSRIADREPERIESQIELAHTALSFGDLITARAALDRFPPKERESIFYHETAGTIYFGLADYLRSEFHFAKALQFAPTNELKQINLARAQLSLPEETSRQTALELLRKIGPSSANYNVALNLLTVDAMQRQNFAQAIDFSTKLSKQSNATFSDKLIRLSVLGVTDRPAFTNALEELKPEAVQQAGSLTEFITWQNSSGLGAPAMAWVRTLPPELLKTAGPGMAVAELYVVVNDWLGLRNWLGGADWGVWQCLRFAYEARAVQNLPHDEQTPGVIAGLWAKAIQASRKIPSLLETLANSAKAWGMLNQSEETWWEIANGSSSQETALMTLFREYLLTDNTFGQYRVARKLLQVNNRNLAAKNNTVYFGLLLKLDAPDLVQLADELYQAAPNEPAYVATYAFALARQNRLTEALTKMEQLPLVELDKPGINLTFGYLLAEAGDRNRAREYLAKAQAGRLLPEEQKLLEEGKTKARM
ncbi:MAG: hypothetical protein EXS36_00880 [Pedosphaera sp.]|nr:hypothetical protein [Pedosphaera sp.]